MFGSSCASRVDLPAQANFLRCARIATRAFPRTVTPRHTSQACLWVRVRVRARVRAKNPLLSRAKPYFIKTASFYAGTSEKVRLRGQICASCQLLVYEDVRCSRIHRGGQRFPISVDCGAKEGVGRFSKGNGGNLSDGAPGSL